MKIKLTYEEKTYVENNRFKKLHVSGSDSDDNDPKDTGRTNHLEVEQDRSNIHQREATTLFQKKNKWTPLSHKSPREV